MSIKISDYFDLREYKSLNSNEITIYCDGSFYNELQLKKEFKLDKDISNDELLLEMYDRYQDTMFSKIDGIFSIVVKDLKNKKLILARDHSSIKPLYYYKDERYIAFSNRLKDLFEFDFIDKEINLAGLSNYFTYGYILQPNTIYKNCYKLVAGHQITIDLTHNSFDEKAFWDLGECYDVEKLKLDEKEFIDGAKRVFINSISKRLKKENKDEIASSLSGGYDSSTISAILSQQREIKTFTIGFDDESINEADDANKIARYLGVEHIVHYFSDEDALNIVPKLCEVYDEPFHDEGSIPTTLLSTIMKENGIKTVFVGDGGDEVFATADNLERFSTYLKYPSFLKANIFDTLSRLDLSLLPYLKDHNNIPTKFYKLMKILSSKDIPNMVKYKMSLFDPFEIRRLMGEEKIQFSSNFDDIYFGEYAQNVDLIIGSFFKSFLLDGEIVKTTNAYAQNSIDIREPFMDKELIAFMARVPQEIKVKDGIKKYILKEIAYEYLPKELLDRPKKGFAAPISRWMKGILNETLVSILNRDNLEKNSILNSDFVLEIKKRFFSGREEYRYKLWAIFLFQLWYEKNFVKKD